MKFQLKVKCPIFPYKSSIYFDEVVQVGLDGVDKIRRDLALPGLELSRIRGIAAPKIESPRIELTEQLARRNGHFTQKNFVCVQVSKQGGLNKFCFQKVGVNKNPETGEVLEAWIEWVLNEEELLDAWEQAGFPLNWEV